MFKAYIKLYLKNERKKIIALKNKAQVTLKGGSLTWM
jgi:hypothetical protein